MEDDQESDSGHKTLTQALRWKKIRQPGRTVTYCVTGDNVMILHGPKAGDFVLGRTW